MVIIYYLGKRCTTLKLSAMTEIKLYVAFNSLFQLKFKRIFVINRFSFSFSAKAFAILPAQMSHDDMWTLLSMLIISFMLLRGLEDYFSKVNRLEVAFDFVKWDNCLCFSQNNRKKQSLFYEWQLWKRKKSFYFLKWKANQICLQLFPIKIFSLM